MMTNLTCQGAAPLIARLIDAALDAPGRSALDTHLSSCAACRATVAAHHHVRAALAARPPVSARLGFDRRVVAAARRDASWFEHWNWRALTWGMAPVAAALVIAAATVVTRATPVARTTATTSAPAVSVVPGSADTVSSALWSDTVSDTSVLSLMLYANADDPMSSRSGRK